MLDSSLWLLHQTQAAEIQRLLRGHLDRVGHCDAAEYDAVRSTLVYTRYGRPAVRYRVEVIGIYRPSAKNFRWGWVGGTDKRGLAQLMSGNLPDVGESDVERLAHLAAHLAGASGVYRHVARLGQEGTRYHYLALFDAESLPAKPVVAPAPVQTLPPAAPDGAPCAALSRKVRSPKEVLLDEVAGTALPLLRKSHPGFREALFSIRVDLRQHKARFFATLSVIDAHGQLQVVDPNMELMDVSARLIGDDHHDGNGRWERLVIRLAGDQHGAVVVRAEAA